MASLEGSQISLLSQYDVNWTIQREAFRDVTIVLDVISPATRAVSVEKSRSLSTDGSCWLLLCGLHICAHVGLPNSPSWL